MRRTYLANRGLGSKVPSDVLLEFFSVRACRWLPLRLLGRGIEEVGQILGIGPADFPAFRQTGGGLGSHESVRLECFDGVEGHFCLFGELTIVKIFSWIGVYLTSVGSGEADESGGVRCSSDSRNLESSSSECVIVLLHLVIVFTPRDSDTRNVKQGVIWSGSVLDSADVQVREH